MGHSPLRASVSPSVQRDAWQCTQDSLSQFRSRLSGREKPTTSVSRKGVNLVDESLSEYLFFIVKRMARVSSLNAINVSKAEDGVDSAPLSGPVSTVCSVACPASSHKPPGGLHAQTGPTSNATAGHQRDAHTYGPSSVFSRPHPCAHSCQSPSKKAVQTPQPRARCLFLGILVR